MKNYSLLFLSILIIIILSNSCCKDITCPQLTTDDRKWIPYKDNDTLVFKNFENDSILRFRIYGYREDELKRKEHGHVCYSKCFSGIQVGIAAIEIENTIAGPYYIEKSDSDIFLSWGGSGLSAYVDGTPSKYDKFDLRRSVYLATIELTNIEMQDVYEFITDTTKVKDIRKTYVKKGIGLVKIVFDDNIEYELINHIK